jgi:hypothetical protein
MGAKNKKSLKKADLLKMHTNERIKLIREVKEKLRQKAIEEKLWQSFLETENVTINGKKVYSEESKLEGLSFSIEQPKYN